MQKIRKVASAISCFVMSRRQRKSSKAYSFRHHFAPSASSCSDFRWALYFLASPPPRLVGGPCLEKDPHILYQSLKDFDYSANLFKEAREVNENMAKAFLPWVSGLNHSSSFGIAGLAFKGNPETSDLRGSLSIEIFNELRDKSTNEINLFDPVKEVIKTQDYENFFSKGKWFENFEQFVVETDILIICNNHSFFKNLLNANKIWDLNPNIEIYDFWNNLSEKLTKENLYKYKVFGRAQKND